MLRAIQIRVFPGEQSGYVAECIDLPVVSQGATIDAALINIREALELHLDGEDAESMGISLTAPLLTTLQLAPLNA
jgi:predicted RNase H-like HicB family nuclease